MREDRGPTDAGRPETLARRLEGWARTLPRRRPWTLIGATVVLALWGAWAYFFQLPIVTTRGALADPTAEHNVRWEAYQEAFQGERDFLVLVLSAPGAEEDSVPPPPDPAQRAAMKEVADRWAEAVSRRPDHFSEVIHRIEPSALGDFALLYLPYEVAEQIRTALEPLLPALETVALDPRPAVALGELRTLLSEIEAPEGEAGEDEGGGGEVRALLGALESGFAWFRARIEDPEAEPPLPEGGALLDALPTTGLDPEGYLFVGEGRLLTVLADTEESDDRRDRYGEAIRIARAALDSALAAVPDTVRIEAGLTGEPALEHEETVASQTDFARSTALAFVLISLLFMWAFRSVLRPGLAALCLGMSIAITFGIAWVGIGHLSVLAMVFAVILVALGIDFAIHFYTHYRRGLAEGRDAPGAVEHTYETVGGALWVAGLATSAAFLSAFFTDFPGLSELGLVAGAGLLVSLLAIFFVYPAMLLLVDLRWSSPPLPKQRPFQFVGAALPRSSSRGRAAVLGAVVLAALGFAFGQYSVNTNLFDLQPSEGDAVRWQWHLLRTEDRTLYALATYEDRESLERARAAFAASPVVAGTESAFPGREEEKRRLLEPLCARIGALDAGEPGPVSVGETRRELFGLRQTLRRFSRADERAREALEGLEGEIAGAFTALGALSPETAEARLAGVAEELARGLEDGLARGKPLLCPPPLTPDRIPQLFRDRHVGADGTYALRIYPARDTWRGANLSWFIEGARAVDPGVFGGIVNVHENAEAMIGSFVQAALYSSLALIVLLLLWSRSLRTAALALFPLGTGLGLLLGLMRWSPFPIEWNLANLFAVPILIGIGVAGGIHLVRAWRLEGRETFRGAMEAVLMSALTTMIGFGLLATGDHAGVSSLGLIVFLGIALNLVVCLLILPAALAWLEPWAKEGGST